MLFLGFFLLAVSFGFLAVGAGVVLYGTYLAFELGRLLRPSKPAGEVTQPGQPGEGAASIPSAVAALRTSRAPGPPSAIRWTAATKLVLLAVVSAFMAR